MPLESHKEYLHVCQWEVMISDVSIKKWCTLLMTRRRVAVMSTITLLSVSLFCMLGKNRKFRGAGETEGEVQARCVCVCGVRLAVQVVLHTCSSTY